MKKKLIEVALPLDAINREAAREKSIRHGHPSTLHLWWARRPLAACRAVLFASLVDDPSSHPDKFKTEKAQNAERERLFKLIEELVKWENSNDEEILKQARKEIMDSCNGNPPTCLDPFSGGGSIPLEAQRLGLDVFASDLNPVAVMITKALVEFPPKFAGRAPVNPDAKNSKKKDWRAAQGLAEDIRYYGEWMRAQAAARIGHLYPNVDQKGKELTPIAWIWARTIACPNPACGREMPLVRSFFLSTKANNEYSISVDDKAEDLKFRVNRGKPRSLKSTVGRKGALCVFCESPVKLDHVRREGRAGRMNCKLMAVVVEDSKKRSYVAATSDMEEAANAASPTFRPDATLPSNPRDFKTPNYGMRTFGDLFTNRQLVALTTFSDLVKEARKRAFDDAVQAGLVNDCQSLNEGGVGATAYADIVSVYLAFAIDKCSDYWCTISTWSSGGEFVRGCFARQAIPMTWDFAETNPFSNATGNISSAIDWIARCISVLPASGVANVRQLDATSSFLVENEGKKYHLISTDPPYYDNIGYSDLSDFFYVWLRRSIGDRFPNIFSTLLTPKDKELIASPHRFEGNREAARDFFEKGLTIAFQQIKRTSLPDYPATIFYAFKQQENEADGGAVSTGWETILSAMIKSELMVLGTWPLRTERSARSVGLGANALASSIALTCRLRPEDAPLATRKEFLSVLRKELPKAVRSLQCSEVAPVDLAQAAIGPGMAIFSRYSKVVEADGSAMSVRQALIQINRVLDECLFEQDSDYDPETRWALAWFSEHAFAEGPYGQAEQLAVAQNTPTDGLVQAGIIKKGGGRVRLLGKDDCNGEWDPLSDQRLTVWEVVHNLIHQLETQGEETAAITLKKLGGTAESSKELAYRLYGICDKKKWSDLALHYNNLAAAWPELTKLANQLNS